MNGFGTLLILGIVMYFLFSRNGAIGCCGGHASRGSQHREPEAPRPKSFRVYGPQENIIELEPRQVPANRGSGEIIDLKPGDYKIVESLPRSE